MSGLRRNFLLLLASVVLLLGACSGPGSGTAPPASNPSNSGPATASATAAPVGVASLITAATGATCAIDESDGVRCWGGGPNGDGTVTSQGTPVSVIRLTSEVKSVVHGSDHTCALTNGEVWCWGSNWYRQLGDGTTIRRVAPVVVQNLPAELTAIAAGMNHTCAISSDGGVWCWGRNHRGQLGDGTSDRRTEPVPVAGLESGVVQIAAGSDFTCALTTTGAVKCWGWNGSGQLGDGSTEDRSTPVEVRGLSGVQAIAAGLAHTCAVTTGGAVACWGENEQGQLGGKSAKSLTPADVAGLPAPAVTVAAGGGHTCAALATGAVFCWGLNKYGQVGDGTTKTRREPTEVAGLSDAKSLAAGLYHTCARTSTGQVSCWGSNQYGQLGNGTRKPVSTTPTKVAEWAVAPTWLEQPSAFDGDDPGEWWTGCEQGDCASVANGRFVVKKTTPGDWILWAHDRAEPLRTTSMTILPGSLSATASPYFGLMCMATNNDGYPDSYYQTMITSDGYLAMFKVARGKYSKLEFAKLDGFSRKHPPEAILTCEQRGSEVYLAAQVEGAPLLTARDKSPLAPGGAALLVGSFRKGTGVMRFDEIDFVAEVNDTP